MISGEIIRGESAAASNFKPPGDPDDIASVVAFLASERARYITGTVVTADGGVTAMM